MNHPHHCQPCTPLCSTVLSAYSKAETLLAYTNQNKSEPSLRPRRSYAKRYRLRSKTESFMPLNANTKAAVLLNDVSKRLTYIKADLDNHPELKNLYRDPLLNTAVILRLFLPYLLIPSQNDRVNVSEKLILLLSMRLESTEHSIPSLTNIMHSDFSFIANHVRRICLIKEHIRYTQCNN